LLVRRAMAEPGEQQIHSLEEARDLLQGALRVWHEGESTREWASAKINLAYAYVALAPFQAEAYNLAQAEASAADALRGFEAIGDDARAEAVRRDLAWVRAKRAELAASQAEAR